MFSQWLARPKARSRSTFQTWPDAPNLRRWGRCRNNLMQTRGFMKPAMNYPLLIRFSVGSVAILCPSHHRSGRPSETNLECRTPVLDPCKKIGAHSLAMRSVLQFIAEPLDTHCISAFRPSACPSGRPRLVRVKVASRNVLVTKGVYLVEKDILAYSDFATSRHGIRNG